MYMYTLKCICISVFFSSNLNTTVLASVFEVLVYSLLEFTEVYKHRQSFIRKAKLKASELSYVARMGVLLN